MALFGEYDIGALYRETISVCLEEIRLTQTERATLFVIVCLSNINTGICYNPDTGRPACQDDVFAYVSSDKLNFYDALASLIRMEVVHLWTDHRKQVLITLNDTLRSSLARVWSDQARPAMIISKRQDADRGERFGYVYIARAENGLHKIGKAKDPEARVRGFAGAVMPFVIEMVHKIPSNDAYQAERLLHQRYSHSRRTGEWFQLSERDVDDLLTISKLDF